MWQTCDIRIVSHTKHGITPFCLVAYYSCHGDVDIYQKGSYGYWKYED